MKSPAPDAARETLIVGYGNELRGDDGVGPHVARALEAMALIGVRVLVRPQLTPDLAAEIAACDRVVFVDAGAVPAQARAGGDGDLVCLREVRPAATPNASAHAPTPEAVLALALALFGHQPAAWLVTIVARDFSFGTRLSAETQRGAAIAISQIRARLAAVTRVRAAKANFGEAVEMGP